MPNNNKITFISFGKISIFFSIAIIVAGAAIIYTLGGLNLGIDFESGVSMQVQFNQENPPSAEEVRAALSTFGTVSVQQITDQEGRYVIKSDLSGEGNDERVTALREQLNTEFGAEQIEVLEVAFIGPRYSSTIARQSIVLTLSALALILVYIWIRFRFRYAISAIAALVHDVLMTVIFIGVTRIELSTTTVAAILTLIGYSLNDTVVIFDRIRENEEIYQRDMAFPNIANISIRQSLSRTLITSLTTLLAVLAIYVFSAGAIKDFALCMIFGVAVGTYSSICVASPVLVSMAKRKTRKETKLQKSKHSDGEVVVATEKVPSVSGGASGGKKEKRAEITVNTERIRQEIIARRKQQQKKKGK